MLPAIKTYYKAPVIKIITYWCMDTLLDWWNRIEFRNTSTLVWWTVLWQRHQDKFVCCSVAKLCLTLCNCVNYSAPGFPFLHCLLEFAQTQVHWVSDAIQPSHPLLPPFLALNLAQHQGLFQWVGFLHQVATVLEPQLQYQSFQWIFRVDFL